MTKKKKIPKFSQFFGEEDNKSFQENNKTLLLSSFHGTFLILTVAKQGIYFPPIL
jgi:hypothetical protein